MKKLNLLICFAFFATILFAQKVTVKEQTQIFGKENHNALVTYVYFNDEKTVGKEVENFFKTYKGKVSEKKGLYTATNVLIPSLSTNPITVYVIKKATGSTNQEVEISFAFDLGTGYVSSTDFSAQYESAKMMVLNWAIQISDKSFNEVVKEEEKIFEKTLKKLDGLNKDKTNLEKTNTDLNKKIEESKTQISENEINIQKINGQIKEQEDAVKQQKEKVDGIKAGYGK